MRKLVTPLFFAVLLITYHLLSITAVRAANCEVGDCSNLEDCQKKIEECQAVISTYSPAHTTNKNQLAALEKQLKNIESLIQSAEHQLKQVEGEIFDREVELEYQREIFNSKVRSFYIQSRKLSPFLLFLAAENAAQLTRELSYRTNAANEDKKVIIQVSQDLKELAEDKEKLEKNQIWLNQSKQSLAPQTEFLRGEVEKVEGYLSTVSAKIASLTAKQEALLAEKASTFQTSVGDVPLADDPASRPDYNPGFSPAFAAFSFGAPHRKGMSQYGAWGRAQAGQSAEDILRAYYGNLEIKKDYSNVSIHVSGYEYCNPDRGRFIDERVDLETYAKRIYEMPSSWIDNDSAALKAQAVAARSYVLARGGKICPSECCQVYKPSNKGGAWDAAVDATRGWVLVANGQPFSAWYASTAGGFIYSYTSGGHTTPGIWDTSCGSQTCWTNEAWEKKADCPWFYKGWYKSRSGSTCGRSHPWLNQEEMADILNAVLVYRSGQGAEHILPVDYVSCFGGSGEPWSMEKMRQEAGNHGGAVTSVSGIEKPFYSSSGKTERLVFQTNRGSFEVAGEEFYTVFNLRAPGRIALKSKLFNIEKK